MYTALFQNDDPAGPPWLAAEDLQRIIEARQPAEVLPALAEVDAAAQDGLWAAGFLSYEAAAGIDESLTVHSASPDRPAPPLLSFGIFKRLSPRQALSPADAFAVDAWQPNITREQFHAAVARIRELIAAGDTYQVNFTFRLRGAFRGQPVALFARLADAQQARHCAYVECDDWAICSASPELFFSLDGERLVSRPMKGTSRRGLRLADDRALAEALSRSAKDRAENAMIVDMIRNDAGRIARVGSVRVSEPFAIEKYPTVWQMTSTVECHTAASIPAIFQAMFPCASVTGAPKVRTMQIIRELEPQPRGVYTGAVGYIGPGRAAHFNVAIRTVAIHKPSGRAEYGVGSGIVWDSDPAAEYAECLAKTEVLNTRWPSFELLETMRIEPGRGCLYLPEHLRRLRESAEYFGYRLDLSAVSAALQELPGKVASATRVRLRVSRDGQFALDAAPAPPWNPAGPWKLRLARSPVDPNDVFLYHKTTHRQVYEAAMADRGECDDVLLFNDRGQITETAIANIVVELDGQLVTPPVECGLLPGVMRGVLLSEGEVSEGVVLLDDLPRIRRIFAVNSVRGGCRRSCIAQGSVWSLVPKIAASRFGY